MDQVITFDSNRIEDNDVFDPRKNMYIEASAGTGKTFTIQQIAARLIKDGTKLSHILIVTYTEKAAGELKDRIRKKIQEVLDNHCIIKDVSEPLTDEQMELFEIALREIDSAQIFTFHSFCQKTLKTYAYDAWRPFDMKLIDDKAIENLIQRKIRDEWPNNPHFKAIFNISLENSSLLDVVLSMVPVEDKLNKIEKNLINAITKYYLDNDGNERNDVVQLVKYSDIKKPDCYDVYCHFVLFRDLLQLPEFKHIYEDVFPKYSDYNTNKTGTKKISNLLSELSDKILSKKQLSNYMLYNSNSYKKIDSWPEELSDAFDILVKIRNNIIELNEYRKNVMKSGIYTFLSEEIPKIYKEWRSEKVEHQYQSYQDMIHAVHHAVAVDRTSLLTEQLRKDYKYGIIDEFQDTNQLQWDIFRTIFIGDESHPLDDHSLFVVGDPKQSIYAFQGADIEVYRNAVRVIGSGRSLKMNFRSTKKIIQACNALFDKDKGSQFFNDNALSFSEETYSKYPEKIAPKADTMFDGSETKPVWVSPASISEYDFAAFAAQKIVECCSPSDADGQKTRLQIFNSKDKNKLRNVSFADFAILVRTRTEFPPIEAALKKLGIPFTRYKDDNLFDSRECMQWTALFSAIDADDFAAYNRRVLNEALMTDFFVLDNDICPANGTKSFTELSTASKANKIYLVSNQCFDDPDCTVRRQIAGYHTLARKFRWSELLEAIYRNSQLETRLAGDLSKLQSLAKFQQIGSYCIDYLYAHRCTIQELVKHLDNLQKGVEKTSDQNGNLVAKNTDFKSVQLMTIHASKGLEFPVVIAVGGNKGYNNNIEGPYRFHEKIDNGGRAIKVNKLAFDDQSKNRQKDEDICEWKRWFYVAYTRASALLILPRYNKFCHEFLKNSIENFVEKSSDYCETFDEYKVPEASEMHELKERVSGILAQDTNSEFIDSNEQKNKIAELQDSIVQKSLIQHSYSSLTAKIHQKEMSMIPETTDDSGKSSDAANDGDEADRESYLSKIDRTKYHIYDGQPVYIADQYDSGKMISTDMDYPRGKLLGNAIHEVFEDIDFSKARSDFDTFSKNPEIDVLIEQKYNKYGFTTQKYPNVVQTTARLVWNTLNAVLPAIDGKFSLKELPSEAHFSEVEFMLAGENSDKSKSCNYFSKGFIDMLFVRNKRYCILDWKSDRMEDEDYANPEKLKERVDADYAVQRVLYSYCLIEWLKQFYDKSDDEDDDAYCERLFQKYFGGIYYVFVRGCYSGTSNGIYAQTWDSYHTLKKNYYALKALMFK